MTESNETYEDTEGEIAETESSRKRKKFHFSVELDVQLLSLTIEENPYESSNKDRTASWKQVAGRLDQQLGTEGLLPRTCKDRVERLCAYYEEDHPCLKTASHDNSIQVQNRLALLEQVQRMRKDSIRDGFSPGLVKRAFRRAESQTHSTSSLARSSAGTVTYTYTAVPISGDDADIRAAIQNGLTVNTSGNGKAPTFLIAGDENSNGILVAKHELNGELDSNERSLVKQLLDAKKAEEVRRTEELEIRKQELEIERQKIELEREKWEFERKEREARLAHDDNERKVILEFMRDFMKKVFPNNFSVDILETSNFPTDPSA